MKKFETIRQARNLAKKKIRKGTFNWLEAAAENGFTRQVNYDELQKIKILPKFLKKTKDINLNKKIFKTVFSCPIVISPMGHQTQFNKFGEIETARGAKKSKALAFFGTQGRMSIKDIRTKNPNLSFGWEIFPFGNLKWIENQIKNAEKYRCNSITICIDANVRSHRYLDRESFYDARKFGKRTNPISPEPELGKSYDWKLITFIKKKTKLPVIVKGILTYQDALNAIKYGASAIWVSNHGGRMFNSGISCIEALRKISKLKKRRKILILADGGVEKGSDIIKYMCAGADIVGIGRAAMYGLILDGGNGVEKIINILKSELETAMINGGFDSLSSFTEDRIYEQ
tara:strand:+ start:686 stop:1717 length:1032 start_codon:yes stop_codon:yes gene_type:complete